MPSKTLSILDFIVQVHSNIKQLLDDLDICPKAKIDFEEIFETIKLIMFKCSTLKQTLQMEIKQLTGKAHDSISREINSLMIKIVSLKDYTIKTAKMFYETMYWIIGIPAFAVIYTPQSFFGILEEFANQIKVCLIDKVNMKPSLDMINRILNEVLKKEQNIKFDEGDDILAKIIDLMKKGYLKSSILRKIHN